ncbi:A24 family peptidase [Vibrio wakamikoensis]|uniref:A24 family peptidase n=1 Tax=Vibrio wakamikoensis TaxID=2910251 RepID=UPI003D2370C5
MCVLVSLSDIRFRRIPNSYILLLSLIAINLAIISNIGFGVLFGVAATLISSLLLRRWFGFGDIKLVMALSFALPWSQWLFAIWLTLILGGLLALVYLIKNRLIAVRESITLPYGVAICGGFYLTIFTFHLHSVGI